MRKMTKTAVTLAAMSAMTIASASLAFAAAQRDQLNAVENPASTSNPNSGKWEGNNADGWTFTPADEKKLANTWAEIDGVWYYFHKDGIMAQDELVYLEGETYYFTPNGSMATGWYAFDKDSDVIYDYNLDIDEYIEDINNPVFRNKDDAYDTIWMYFLADGKAADDEWLQADSGLWYYFDDIIMACGDYDHEIGNSYYGFAEDGHMYVGWEQNVTNAHIKAPNKEDASWYYYDSNGKKFYVTDENHGVKYGWKKINGKWYCFRSQIEDTNPVFSVGTLITDAYFSNKVTADINNDDVDYYYVDKNGVMSTGVVTVDKDSLYITAETDWRGTKQPIVGKKWDVLFDGNGVAKADSWSGDRFYAGINSKKVKNFVEEDGIYSITGYKSDVSAKVKGALVKNSLILTSDHVYYVDKDGDKYTNRRLALGYVLAKQTDNSPVKYDSVYVTIDTAQNDIDEMLNNGYKKYEAYYLFNGKGEAYDEDANQKRTVGGKTYCSTGLRFEGVEDAVIYFYPNNPLVR